MTEDQFLSLFHFDHNIYHESKHERCDEYWNLTPMLIREHREKTRQDLTIIAKGKRVRKAFAKLATLQRVENEKIAGRIFNCGYKRKIPSRGFDKTRRRKMDGTVVPK